MLVQKQLLTKALRRSETFLASNDMTLSLSSSSSSSWIRLRSVLFNTSPSSSPSSVSSVRGSLKSPRSRRTRKNSLLAKQWKSLFDEDGKLSDGIKFLKRIRTGGVEPSIRAEVWPFLLGMYDVKSSKKERETVKAQRRRGYLELRKRCRQISRCGEISFKMDTSISYRNEDCLDNYQGLDSPNLDEVASAKPVSIAVASMSGEVMCKNGRNFFLHSSKELIEQKENAVDENVPESETGSTDSLSFEVSEETKPLMGSIETADNHYLEPADLEIRSASCKTEDFATWQKIIRLDAIRANAEWIIYSPSQAAVSELKAQQLAESVGLQDYDHLEPCRIHHAARLVAILEAYAVYDTEIGYCQGMSDLLSPIISVIEDDYIAFWCFVGFMHKARHNFRLDEIGIRIQLNIVSKIIKCKDSHLYQHLEKLQAEDCFFVYRMVVVLFSRELTFEQTLCLWEVMWADQAAIRAGIVKSAWRRMRLRAPPTDDLLLYVVAACVLQKRKLIVEKYSNMDDIMKECNNMAGHLNVWKLLDDAHDLIVTLHDKI